ncbi:hypothetical protein BTR23_18815 [Alkalihalophilus pseudofirmus]|nr:hypothetical protein BTR23_18815 [Alkalihalophilus pseudofirmus]
MAHELKNLSFLIIIATFGFLYYFDVQKLPQAEERHIVELLFYALIVLLAIEASKTIYKLVKSIKQKEGNENTFSLSRVVDFIKDKQIILLISFIGYVFLIPITGFFSASLLFVICLNLVLKNTKLWELTLLPIVLLSLIYVLFVIFLGIKLPSGILF